MRDCVSREMERALMRAVVVRLSFCQCLMKERVVLSLTHRTQ
jgi:hypothetical protein